MNMIERLLSEIKKVFTLTERPESEYSKAKVSGLTFSIRSFEAKGLGNVSVMSGKGMLGLMAMDTLIINPFDCDAPLFSYDRIHAMGNDTVFLELYETRIDKTASLKGVDEVVKKFSFLPDEATKPYWYDSVRLPQSLKKKGKKAETPKYDELVLEYLVQYLKAVKASPACDRILKLKEARAYTEGLLDNGGVSTDAFLKKKGKEWTTRMFREYIFGTGDPV